MDQDFPVPDPDRWRVVVFTNLPGGVFYTAMDDLLPRLGHTIVGVVTTPGPKRRRSPGYLDVVRVVRPGVDVIVSNHPERWDAMLAPLRPDLIISGSFPWRIPAGVLDLPRLGAINVHPALLPKYRGPNPIRWALRNGDTTLGMTVHRTTADFDAGAILAQSSISIAENESGAAILARLGALAPQLIQQALERIARGEVGDPQDDALASYAGAFDDEWGEIDWSQSARTVHNHVRAWNVFRDRSNGAWARIDGKVVRVVQTRLLPEPEPSSAVPGTVLDRNEERLVVQCGDGPLEITTWLDTETGAA
jgi:methionyl-tRNA formyltransferase